MMAASLKELTHRLRELRDALQVSRHLSLKAVGWDHLQRKDADGNNSGVRPYTDAAIATFTKALDQNEDDPDVLHHLAIAHHARAWDLELQGSVEALVAWEEALTYWRRLQTCAPFWQRLREKGKQLDPAFDPATIDEARQNVSQHLLEVHLDFIRHYYDQGHVERAEHHIRLIRRAPLPPAVRKQMDHRLYEAMTSGVSVALTTHDHAAALQSLERYLRLFPQYLPALQQVCEIYQAWLEQTSIQDQWNQVESLQRQVKPYVLRLAAHPDFTAQPLARIAVGSLAFTLGDKYEDRARALQGQRKQNGEVLDEAAGRLEHQTWDETITWLGLAQEYDPGRPYLINAVTRAYLQRANLLLQLGVNMEDAAVRNRCFSDAFSDCQRILDRTPDHSDALFLGAQALMLQKRLAEAIPLAERLVTVARQTHDQDTLETAQQLLSQLRRRPVIDEAVAHMRAGRFREALPLLDQLIEQAPQACQLYIRRAECHVALDNVGAADTDADNAEHTAQTEDDHESVQELRSSLNDMRERIQQSGSLAAYQLRQEAIRAFNNDNYDEAIAKLRDALASLPSAAKEKGFRRWFSREVNPPKQNLEKELATCLNARSVKTMEHVMETFKQQRSWSPQLLRSLHQAETALNEAARLDAENITVKQNREVLQHMLDSARSASR